MLYFIAQRFFAAREVLLVSLFLAKLLVNPLTRGPVHEPDLGDGPRLALGQVDLYPDSLAGPRLPLGVGLAVQGLAAGALLAVLLARGARGARQRQLLF